jgi:hypothetical protein
MSNPYSITYEYLLTHYGPLLTLKHLAEVMHSTPNGIRMAMARKRQPVAVALADARHRLGRRVYFEARVIAEVIDQGLASTPYKKSPVAEGVGMQSRLAYTSSE